MNNKTAHKNGLPIDLEDLEAIIENNRYYAFKVYDLNNTCLYPFESSNADLTAEQVKDELERAFDRFNHNKFRVVLPMYKHEEFMQLTAAERRQSYTNGAKYIIEFEAAEEELEELEPIQMPQAPQISNNQNINILAFMQMQQNQFNMMMQREAEHNRRLMEQQRQNFEAQLQYLEQLRNIEHEEAQEAINGIEEEQTLKQEQAATMIDSIKDLAIVLVEKFTSKQQPQNPVSAPPQKSKAEELLERWQQIDPEAIQRFEETVNGIEQNPELYYEQLNQATQYEQEQDEPEQY